MQTFIFQSTWANFLVNILLASDDEREAEREEVKREQQNQREELADKQKAKVEEEGEKEKEKIEDDLKK